MEGVADPGTSFSFRQSIGGALSFFHCFLHIPGLFTIVFFILHAYSWIKLFYVLICLLFLLFTYCYIYRAGPLTGPITYIYIHGSFDWSADWSCYFYFLLCLFTLAFFHSCFRVRLHCATKKPFCPVFCLYTSD